MDPVNYIKKIKPKTLEIFHFHFEELENEKLKYYIKVPDVLHCKGFFKMLDNQV